MRFLPALLLLLALHLPAAAQRRPAPAPAPVDTTTEAALHRGAGPRWLNKLILTAPGLARHQVGVSIADANTGETLYELNAGQYFTPASTMKLFSLYAGLHLLGDSLPSLRYVLRPDTLLFWGTGDPTLLHGDVPSRRAFTFLQSRPEQLFYAPVPCVEPYGPGWSWDDYNYYYAPERGPFPIYGNTVRFYGKLPQRTLVLPRDFRPLTEPAPASLSSADHVRRDQLENRFYVLPFTKEWVDEVPFRTSPGLLLKLLQDTLRRPVRPLPWRLRPQDSLRTLSGLPVDSLYRRMLQVSDNFLAEQLLLMCASRLRPDSLNTARVISTVRRQFLQDLPDAPGWVDGSGLSRLNLATPRTMTALLLKLHREVAEPRLLNLLAAGGGHGTLRRRYRPAPGAPAWFWGKTGTLTHVCNLTGYVRTRHGRLLAVTFFNNNIAADDKPVRDAMERILGEVRTRL